MLTLLLALASLCLAACGSGGGGSTSTQAQEGKGATTSAKEAQGAKRSGEGGSAEPAPGPPASAFHPKPHPDSGGGSAQFVVKGGDNSVQEYGAEAGEAELHEAAAALHGFLDARAERNWAAACSYLARPVTQGFAQLASRSSKSKGQTCAATLAALTGRTPTAALREAAIADVGSLRAKGDRAFLIYRGTPHGTVYAISMAREGGAWKVGSLGGTPLG